jgi:uncharacterized protein (TIGR00251 family)
MSIKRVCIHVIPNARKDEINDEESVLTVRTNAPPDKGKANRAVLKMLSKHLGVRVRLVSGEKSRDKIIEYDDKREDGSDGRN